MRKTIIIVTLLMLLLLAMCLLCVWYMLHSTGQLLLQLPQLRVLVEQRRWDEAQLAQQRLHQTLEQVSRRWKALINHDDMRDIEVALAGLASAIELQDGDEAIMELEELDFFIRHVADTERVNAGNIL